MTFLFPKVKINLKGKRFKDAGEIKERTTFVRLQTMLK